MMLKIAVLLALVVAANAMSFEEFKNTFNKQYASAEEEASRFQIFSENIDFINQHNSEAANGFHSHTVGVNQFADLTNKEFVEQYTGYMHLEGMDVADLSEVKPAATIDWRDQV